MKVIGLTGGAGAGKSLVSEILKKEMGAQVITADEVAHDLMEKGRPGYVAVIRALGSDFLDSDGSIDRQKLAGLIFKDQEALKTMNGIIHPLVWKTVEEKISTSQAELIVVEFAVVGGADPKRFDELWYVYADERTRARRLITTRGYSRERIRGIFEGQLTEEEFRRIASRVIDNSGSVEDLKKQIFAIRDEKEAAI